MTLANNVKILKAWSTVDFLIPAETESALEFDILIREAAKKFHLIVVGPLRRGGIRPDH